MNIHNLLHSAHSATIWFLPVAMDMHNINQSTAVYQVKLWNVKGEWMQETSWAFSKNGFPDWVNDNVLVKQFFVIFTNW